MCGRTGLCLHKQNLISACSYKKEGNDKYISPKYYDEYNLGKEYKPCQNIAPTDVTPVLINSKNFGGNNDDRLLKPMMWGMVPPWHKGDYRHHGLSTNNCRIENILASKLYSEPLNNGQRCIVLADGFYEWQTTNKTSKTRQPYFIYMPQPDTLNIEDPTSWNATFDDLKGWNGINLLKMAGVYNTWRNSDEGDVLYSYSVITMESNETFSWLHHRMPAILYTEQMVKNWLNPEIPGEQAVTSLTKNPIKKIQFHPTSNLVNNSKNKDENLNLYKKIELEKKKNTLMDKWVVKKRKSNDVENSDEKKYKI